MTEGKGVKMAEERRLEMAEEDRVEMGEEERAENFSSEQFLELFQQQPVQKPTKMVTNKRKEVKSNKDTCTKIHIAAAESGVAYHASFGSRKGHLNILTAKGAKTGKRLKPRKLPKWLLQTRWQSAFSNAKII